MKKPFEKIEHGDELTRGVKYKPWGYWHTSTIRLSQRRDIETREFLTPEVDWSAGGRDHKEEPSNLSAAENFALALADAIQTAKAWEREMEGREA